MFLIFARKETFPVPQCYNRVEDLNRKKLDCTLSLLLYLLLGSVEEDHEKS